MLQQLRTITKVPHAIAVSLTFMTVGGQPFAFSQQTTVKKEAVTNALSSPNGRYVFGRLGDVRQDTFMLDTQTGRLWMLTQGSDLDRLILEPIFYIKPGAAEYTLVPTPASSADVFESAKKTPAELRLQND